MVGPEPSCAAFRGDAPSRGLSTAYVLAATGKPWDRHVALLVADTVPKRQAPVTAANQRLWRNRHRLFMAAFVKPLAEWFARPLER